MSLLRGADPTKPQLVTVTVPATGVAANNLAGGTVAFPIDVTDAFEIQSLTLSLDISTTDVSRLSAALISPSNTVVPLFTNPGTFATNRANMQNVTLDDAATTPIQLGNPPYTSGTFNPQKPLSAVVGETSKGRWTLLITNAGGAGTLNDFALNFRNRFPAPASANKASTSSRRISAFRAGPDQCADEDVWTKSAPTAENQAASGGAAHSAVAIDPADPSGNTVYVGTTNGGVWKTSNFLTNDPLGPS